MGKPTLPTRERVSVMKLINIRTETPNGFLKAVEECQEQGTGNSLSYSIDCYRIESILFQLKSMNK